MKPKLYVKTESESVIYSRATGEPIQANAVDIIAVQWSKDDETCIVTFALGGYDSHGVFCADSTRPVIRYKLSKTTTPKAWNDNKLSDDPSIDNVRAALADEPAAISSVAASRWGISGLEFSKGKAQ